MKKKVVILTHSYLPIVGGEQVEMKLLLDELDVYLDSGAGKYKFYFISPSIDSAPFCQFRNIPVYYLAANNSRLNLLKNVFKLHKILKDLNPDLIYGYSILPVGLMVYLSNFWGKKYNYIIASHGSDLAVFPAINYGNRLNKINNFWAKVVVKNELCHQIPSRAMLSFCDDLHLPRQQVFILPNAIPDRLEYLPSAKKLREIRERYNLRVDDYVILSLSGFRSVKGLDCLIEAMGKLLLIDSRFKLVLASGENSYSEQLKQQVKTNHLAGNVHFVGLVSGEEKETFFQLADLFVLPSLFESFGLVLIEAMRRRKICLASNIAGINDIIVDGKNGFLAAAGSSDDWAKKMEYIYRHRETKNELMDNALVTAENYLIKKILPEFLKLLDT